MSSLRQGLVRVPHFYRRHGWRATVSVIVKNLVQALRLGLDRRFDRRHAVDTVGRVELATLTIDSPNRHAGVYYEPTPWRVFHRIMRGLAIDYGRYEFVDYGCGKGRVLCMAARFPFRRIVGVEFAAELAQAARRNVRGLRERHPACPAMQVRHEDAVDFAVPDGPAVLYFFNPFEPEVMRRVLDNIEANVRRGGGEKIVVYYHPQAAALFDASPCLRRVQRKRRLFDPTGPQLRGFAVYRSVSPFAAG